MPTYDGGGRAAVVSAVERFDVEAWLRQADLPAAHRDVLLALLAREVKLAEEAEDLQGQLDESDFELEDVKRKVANAEADQAAAGVVAEEIRGNYTDLVKALRGWLTAYPDHPQLEAELRDHEAVVRGYQPTQEKSL